MRLPWRRAVLPLVLYLLLVAALAWWINEALDQAAATVMEDTAHLVASEVAAALDEQLVSDLLEGTPAARLRLIGALQDEKRPATPPRPPPAARRCGRGVWPAAGGRSFTSSAPPRDVAGPTCSSFPCSATPSSSATCGWGSNPLGARRALPRRGAGRSPA